MQNKRQVRNTILSYLEPFLSPAHERDGNLWVLLISQCTCIHIPITLNTFLRTLYEHMPFITVEKPAQYSQIKPANCSGMPHVRVSHHGHRRHEGKQHPHTDPVAGLQRDRFPASPHHNLARSVGVYTCQGVAERFYGLRQDVYRKLNASALFLNHGAKPATCKSRQGVVVVGKVAEVTVAKAEGAKKYGAIGHDGTVGGDEYRGS